MINDSDYCIFYYNKNYQPEMRKYSKRSVGYYHPKSGTKLAFDYAKKRKKQYLTLYFTNLDLIDTISNYICYNKNNN